MADLFLIGASGTKAYRSMMGAISENIANASTEGYTRRSVSVRESTVSGAVQVFYKSSANFGGVEVAGVNRANDPYLDANVRLTSASLGSADIRARWMTDVETGLNDDDLGIGHRLSDMFGSITQLAASPNDPSLRTNVLYGVEQVVTAFHNTANDLKTTSDAIVTVAQADVAKANDALAELGRVNANLLRAQPGTANYAQLLDARDAALNTISSKLDANVTFEANGTATVAYNGTNMVQGATAGTLAMTAAADGTLSLTLNGNAVAAPTTGALGGAFQSATVTAQRIATVDTLAVKFATDMNAWHAQGRTDAGNPGGQLVSVGTTAASLTQVITSTADIAVKSADGTLNGNLINIASVRGSNSVEAGWTALVAQHANLLSGVTAEQTAAQSRDTQARQARENVSGVDLDVEAADLLRVQQAYSGSAKIIQVARETMQDILNLF